MWADALAAHQAGRVRAVEVRGSDYIGPRMGEQGHITRILSRALAGRSVRVFGSPDQPHSWTDARDMARALVAVAGHEPASGRVWHAPTGERPTQRDAVTDLCRAVGREPGAARAHPASVSALGGRVSPLLRELRETEYQFRRPYVLDSSAIAHELGLHPTPWSEVCRATAEDALDTAPVGV
jgi:nucleoside-diphosphate-sugar epimerase